ncbi:hypothetical protein BHYA_0040g00060 [Botrytis hyacinthi]|uniref:Uncharacterized protein n=1 Tax=Botrytis hyacinthi TaxID=278943 RepID=A0A4Z1GUR1_9HELO|nr:hypothetical protein BHYA_0040g00060 [Botrytis hyacinthi]
MKVDEWALDKTFEDVQNRLIDIGSKYTKDEVYDQMHNAKPEDRYYSAHHALRTSENLKRTIELNPDQKRQENDRSTFRMFAIRYLISALCKRLPLRGGFVVKKLDSSAAL